MTPWNHNNHFHHYLLSYVPQNRTRALDIGCGAGQFASRLASVFQTVDALDSDPQAIANGRRQFAHTPNLTFHHTPFDNFAPPAHSYNFISIIATLHHLPLEPTVTKIKHLLKPNGILAILGLYKEETISDLLYSIVSIPLNRLYNGRTSLTPPHPPIITTAPEIGLRDISKTMRRLTPNHRFKRHLFWRYSIIWQKPQQS